MFFWKNIYLHKTVILYITGRIYYSRKILLIMIQNIIIHIRIKDINTSIICVIFVTYHVNVYNMYYF